MRYHMSIACPILEFRHITYLISQTLRGHKKKRQQKWSSNPTALRKRWKFSSRKSATNATPRCWTLKSSVAASIKKRLSFWYLNCRENFERSMSWGNFQIPHDPLICLWESLVLKEWSTENCKKGKIEWWKDRFGWESKIFIGEGLRDVWKSGWTCERNKTRDSYHQSVQANLPRLAENKNPTSLSLTEKSSGSPESPSPSWLQTAGTPQ